MSKIRGSKVQANTIYNPILVMDVKISEMLLKSDRLSILETKTPFIVSNLKYQLKGMHHTLFKFT